MPSADQLQHPAPDDAFGATLAAKLGANYRIIRELGRGGMARVYLARDLRHSRFDCGSDSPVREDSSTATLAAQRTTPSAATRCPSRNTSTSPGTTSSSGTEISCPSRTTSAKGAAARANFSSAARERA